MKWFIALLLAIPAAHAEEDVDYWKGTGLHPKNFMADVVPRCNDSTDTLLGCMDALNGLAGVAEHPIKYVSVGEKEAGAPELGEIVENNPDGLIGYTLSTGVRRFITDFRKITSSQKELHYKMTQALHKRNLQTNTKIDFKSRFEQAFLRVDQSVMKEYEEAVTAELYNLFFADVWDPHTQLIPAAELTAQIDDPNEKKKGFGIQYFKDVSEGTYLSSITEDSPAWKAGLRRNDQIVSIDRVFLYGKTFDQVKALIDGPVGKESDLYIRRGRKKFWVTMTRSEYTVLNVASKIVEDLGVKYGYIKIRSFQDFTADETIAKYLKDFETQGVQGVILDLRDNGGGFIDTAFDIGSEFVGHKVIATVKTIAEEETNSREISPTGTSPAKSEDKYGKYQQLTSLPMVTLINGSSASASEVLSGALQAHQRSFIVGDRSFGKGTAQKTTGNFYSVSYPKTGKIKECRTNLRFYQPNGRTNQIVGILPDFQVPVFPDAKPEDEQMTREEDRYLNALPPQSSPWTQPRPMIIDPIKVCLTQKQAERTFHNLDNILPNGADYRLLVAQEVLKCAK